MNAHMQEAVPADYGLRKMKESEYIKNRLAEIPKEIKLAQTSLRDEEKNLKERLKEVERKEAEERKEQEKKALAEVVRLSTSDRNLLVSLHNYYGKQERWSGTEKERDLLLSYLEERIRRHTEFIANPVMEF